ncbi:MAG: uncharacterized protein H6R26_1886 [Proteobacteria bacterium]|nr:uncharacterized protein [Pseudomonadota bacterium]
MQLIKDGKIAQDDWIHLTDEEALPPGGYYTVSLARWQRERDELLAKSQPLGLRVRGEDPVSLFASDLSALALICIEIPTMTDGRGFSLARQLRDHYGYGGEIRVRGDFIRDQLFFFSRVGVNAFECGPGQDLEALLPALQEFTVKYQAGADEKQPLYRRRH